MVFINQNSASERTPYTYLIGWSNLNKWYYGTKYGKDADPDLFWINYFTSSEFVAEFRRMHGDPDVKEIRRTFETPEQALAWEIKVLKRMRVKSDKKWLNRNYGFSGAPTLANTAGYASAMLAKTKEPLGKISLDDPRWDTGEIVHTIVDRVAAYDKEGQVFKVYPDDAQVMDGTLVIDTGRKLMVDKEGNTSYRHLDDPKVLSGELRKYEYRPRVHIGTVAAYDKNDRLHRVKPDDARILSGELIAERGRIAVVNKDGDTLYVRKGDKRIDDGILILKKNKKKVTKHDNKGRKTAVDKSGKRYRVHLTDPRLENGELTLI